MYREETRGVELIPICNHTAKCHSQEFVQVCCLTLIWAWLISDALSKNLPKSSFVLAFSHQNPPTQNGMKGRESTFPSNFKCMETCPYPKSCGSDLLTGEIWKELSSSCCLSHYRRIPSLLRRQKQTRKTLASPHSLSPSESFSLLLFLPAHV